MGDKTKIEWSEASWNPLRGCSRTSPGCENCYAEGAAWSTNRKMIALGNKPPYDGLVRLNKKGEPVWTGKVAFVPEHFVDPLRWKRPRKIFVNSMSDIFHESVSFETIAAIYGVMIAADWHVFQLLTKRAGRMVDFYHWLDDQVALHGSTAGSRALWNETTICLHYAVRELKLRNMWFTIPGPAREAIIAAGERSEHDGGGGYKRVPPRAWPPKNVWPGISVENQYYASERIPLLLTLPAATRWVSYEPGLGPVHLKPWLVDMEVLPDPTLMRRTLDWVVVGGESKLPKPKARPFDTDWAQQVLDECVGSTTRVFVKQLGSNAMHGGRSLKLRHPKGGDMNEWPSRLRVREYPDAA